MNMGRWRRVGWGVAAMAVGMAVSAPGATAQVTDDRDCRCVDADGDAIENCTCFVVPDVPRVMAFGPDGDFTLPLPPNRPRLGVTVNAEQEDAVSAQGARVSDVMEDGPADEAGIREGDVITHIGGRSLLEPLGGDAEDDFDLDRSIPVQRLLALAGDFDSGEQVEVRYLRNGQAMTATVEVQEIGAAWGMWARDFRADLEPRMEVLREQLREQRGDLERRRIMMFDGNEARALGFGPASVAGLSLVDLNPGLGAYFGTDQGVLVTEVDEESPLGLQEGDVILRIGDREVTSSTQARRILGSYGDDEEVRLRVLRQSAEMDVLGRLGS